MQTTRSGGGFSRSPPNRPIARADLSNDSDDDTDMLMFGDSSDDSGSEYDSQRKKRHQTHSLHYQSRSHPQRGHAEETPHHHLAESSVSTKEFGLEHFSSDNNHSYHHECEVSANNEEQSGLSQHDGGHRGADASLYSESASSGGQEFGGLPRTPGDLFPISARIANHHHSLSNQDESPPKRFTSNYQGNADAPVDPQGISFPEHSDHQGASYHYSVNNNRPDYSPREDFLVHAFDSNAMKLEPRESLRGNQEEESDAIAGSSSPPPYAALGSSDIGSGPPFHRLQGPLTQPPSLFRPNSFNTASSSGTSGVGNTMNAINDRVFLGKRAGRFAPPPMSAPAPSHLDVLFTPQLPAPPPATFPLARSSNFHDQMAVDRSAPPSRRRNSKRSESRRASLTTTATTPTSSYPVATTPTATPPSRWLREEDEQLREAVARFGGKNWKMIAESLGNGRTDVQCLHRWNKVLKPGLVKGPWTPEEDGILSQLISRYGVGKIRWCDVAQHLPGRIGKQCRERWCNHLDSRIRKGQWTPEEDDVVFSWQQKLGNKWSEIAKLLPGRTENAVKNRFNSAARRKWMIRVAGGGSGATPTEAPKPVDVAVPSPNLQLEPLRITPPSLITSMDGMHHQTLAPPGILSPSSAFYLPRPGVVPSSNLHTSSPAGMHGLSSFDMEAKRPAHDLMSPQPRMQFYQPQIPPPPPLVATAPVHILERLHTPEHHGPLHRPSSIRASILDLPIGLALPAAPFAQAAPPPPPPGYSLSGAFTTTSGDTDAGDPVGVSESLPNQNESHDKSESEEERGESATCGADPIPAMDDENMNRFLDSVALELEDMME